MKKCFVAGLVVMFFTSASFAADLIGGSVVTTNASATNVLLGSVVQGSISNRASGVFSHAEGFTTEASGGGAHAEGMITTASGPYSHAEGVLTVAGGYASHAAGYNASATNDFTFVWSDGIEVGSTTSNQFTVHAANGIRLLGGVIEGDAGGLINLNATQLVGRISTTNLPSSGTWNAAGLTVTNLSIGSIAGDVAAMTNLTLNGNALGSVISNLQQQVTAVYASGSSITVQVTDNATTNGLNLIAAYAAATNLNPSWSNRVAVIVPPGHYYLGTGGLMMDAPYVDLIGQTSDRAVQYLFGTPPTQNGGVIKQTSDNVRIENLTLYTQSQGQNIDSSDSSAYFPTVPGSNTVIRNCEFGGEWSMRVGVEYAGRYEYCVAGDFSFGGGFGGGVAGGIFTGCVGGYSSFGGIWGTASGIFRDCRAGQDSFAGECSVANGTFTGCVAGDYSFGGDSVASGIFTDCQAGTDSFGGWYGPAEGTFTDCRAGMCSFGAGNTASGTFTDCQGGDVSFGGYGGVASGSFTDCQGGVGSFGGYGGTLSSNAVLVNCTAGTESFGSFNMAAANFNYNASGYTFAGGPITGDGSGLTNLNVVTTEADPVFTSSTAAEIYSSDVENWNTAYSWGDHAAAGYATGTPVYVESDPVFANSAAADIAATNITAWNSGSTNALRLDGSRAMQASLDMGGHSVTNVGELTLQTNLTVRGQFIATYIPRQGDLLMGSFTNGLPQ